MSSLTNVFFQIRKGKSGTVKNYHSVSFYVDVTANLKPFVITETSCERVAKRIYILGFVLIIVTVARW